VSEARWTNPSQPQTLQIAVFLLYAHAFFTVLHYMQNAEIYRRFLSPWGYFLVGMAVLGVLAARGIASEAKWAYPAGLAVALSPFIFRVLAYESVNALFDEDLINLMFEIALVALLIHPQSRDYQRIWFK